MEERWGRRRGSQLGGSVALVVRTGITEGERGLERAEDEGSRSPKEMTSSDARVAQVEERETFDARGLSPLPMPEALPDLPPSIGQIHRTTSEPVRPVSIALSTLPRHNSQPPPFQSPDPLHTTTPPSTQRTTRQKFLAPFHTLLSLRTSTKPRTRRKRNTEKLATRFVVVSLLLFCITAITCTPPTVPLPERRCIDNRHRPSVLPPELPELPTHSVHWHFIHPIHLCHQSTPLPNPHSTQKTPQGDIVTTSPRRPSRRGNHSGGTELGGTRRRGR